MKTKTRTLAAICVLGFIGTLNVDASNFRNGNHNGLVEEVKNTNASLVAFAGKTSFESNAKVETVRFLLNEDAGATIDLEKEAQLVTKWVVDQAEARFIKQFIDEGKIVEFETVQLPLNEVADAEIDLHREAQLATKLVVDQEEAKFIKNLIDNGKLAEFN